jgi:hypothetical protein
LQHEGGQFNGLVVIALIKGLLGECQGVDAVVCFLSGISFRGSRRLRQGTTAQEQTT